MLSNRISNVLLLLVLASLIFTGAESLYGNDLRALSSSFMAGIPFMSSRIVREKLSSGLAPSGNKYASYYHDDGGNIYALVIIPVPEDSDSDVSSELEISAQDTAILEAQSILAFILGQGGTDRNLFMYDDALGSALLKYYKDGIKSKKLRGIETTAGVLEGGKFAAGVARISSGTAKILGADIPKPGTLDDDYCRYLYRRMALVLFRAGQYEEALPVFRNIHDFRWSDVGAYLDASECFLRTGRAEECVKLLRELSSALDGKMSSADFRRSGNLFREAGDKDSARDSFVRARRRLHDENKKGVQLDMPDSASFHAD